MLLGIAEIYSQLSLFILPKNYNFLISFHGFFVSDFFFYCNVLLSFLSYSRHPIVFVFPFIFIVVCIDLYAVPSRLGYIFAVNILLFPGKWRTHIQFIINQ